VTDLDAFHAWVIRRGRSSITADSYRIQVRACLASRNLTDRLVSPELSPNTKRHCLAALRAWARFSQDAPLLAELADLRLPPPERVKEKRPLAEDALWQLIDAIEKNTALRPAERAALLILCKRGIRVGGVAALRREAIRKAVDDGVLIFKTKQRTMRYGTTVIQPELALLAGQPGRWAQVADLLCPTASEGNRVKAARRRLWELLRGAAERAGIPHAEVYPHRLRRTYATLYLDEVKGDITKLKDHMQWADIKTAATYVDHSRREELDQVAERMLARRRKPKRKAKPKRAEEEDQP
jgi:integrase